MARRWPSHEGSHLATANIGRQADFFSGTWNGITFPHSSGGIHFVAFFLKLPGTKNSMIFAINHPTGKNKTGAKKFFYFDKSLQMLFYRGFLRPFKIRRMAAMVFQFRVVAGTPYSLSIWPR